jgi:acetoacetyl-CoA synthetase
VPALIAQVQELPVTHSGKRSERAARDAINGRPIADPQALANPQSLEPIRAAVIASTEQQRQLEDAAGRSPEAPTESRVTAIWEAILGVALTPHDNFFELGGTSLTAVRLLQAIHERLGIELPPAVFIYAQTPAQMAALIDGPAERRAPILIPLRAGSGERPLFVVHAMGGDVLHVRPLALALDTDRPIYGLQARGVNPRYEPQTSVEEMASTYVDVIRLVQPTGPYALTGYSMGGLLAFDMARRLSAAGERVDSLALIDTDLHPECLSAPARWRFQAAGPYRYMRYTMAAPRTRAPMFARKALRRLTPRRPIESTQPDHSRLSRFAQLEQIGWQAYEAYRPGAYDGQATLFLAGTRYPSFCNPAAAWRRYVRGGLTVHRIARDHASLIAEGTVGPLAERFSAWLRETDSGYSARRGTEML